MAEGTDMAGMTIPELEEMARSADRVCKMTHRAQAGHPGGSLSNRHSVLFTVIDFEQSHQSLIGKIETDLFSQRSSSRDVCRSC